MGFMFEEGDMTLAWAGTFHLLCKYTCRCVEWLGS